jgi:hypothetical protein
MSAMYMKSLLLESWYPERKSSEDGILAASFFLFRKTRNKAKQKNCFAKFRLFRETKNSEILFCFVERKISFRSIKGKI